jgi:rhamnogalacturonyl hydrolase YesR
MAQKISQEEIQKFLEKVKKLEKGEKLDLSSDEDLSIGIMNLISIEEHLFFTYNKTKDQKYLELLNEVREMRKDLLKRIIKDYEG